jgi:hypothetical protein
MKRAVRQTHQLAQQRDISLKEAAFTVALQSLLDN